MRTTIDLSTYRERGHRLEAPEEQTRDLPPWSSIDECVTVIDDGIRPVSRCQASSFRIFYRRIEETRVEPRAKASSLSRDGAFFVFKKCM